MADVRMNLEEADGGLPAICMRCGEEATVTKTKKMSWCPQWVGFLILVAWPIWLVVTLILTKRATVQAPLCDNHKGHWFYRTLIILGSLAVFGVLGIGSFALIMSLQQPGGRNDNAGFACLLPVGLFVVWIIILVIVQQTAIRPKEITDTHITIQGVSSEFSEAVQDLQHERRERRRERRRRAMEDEEDDEPPPPRKKNRPSSDAIEE
jgi:hypothetical protein